MKMRSVALAAGLLLVATAASAETVEFVDTETAAVRTPQMMLDTGEDTVLVKGMEYIPTSFKKWFRIYTTFATTEEWIDRLTLEFYVLFPDQTNVFRGVQHFTDLPRGRAHVSDMYLHFNTYARYYKRGTVNYAIVAIVNGKEVAVDTNKRSPENWWKTMPAAPSGLLDHRQTPFATVNFEQVESQPPGR